MKDFILLGSIAWLFYYLGSNKPLKKLMTPKKPFSDGKTPPTKTDESKKFVVVNNANGTILFNDTEANELPEYGNGRKPIVKVENRTFLGIVTGIFKNNMVQVATKINTQTQNFWVHVKDVVLLTEKQYNISKNNADIIDKTTDVKIKLLQNA